MQNLSFHHIGVATFSLKESITLYEKLGYNWQENKIYEDPIQKVRIAFVSKQHHPIIELIEPINEASPINSILQKVKTSPYHTCYEVDDIEETIKYFKTLKFIQTIKPVPAIAFNNRFVSFLYNKHSGLIELLQR